MISNKLNTTPSSICYPFIAYKLLKGKYESCPVYIVNREYMQVEFISCILCACVSVFAITTYEYLYPVIVMQMNED